MSSLIKIDDAKKARTYLGSATLPRFRGRGKRLRGIHVYICTDKRWQSDNHFHKGEVPQSCPDCTGLQRLDREAKEARKAKEALEAQKAQEAKKNEQPQG